MNCQSGVWSPEAWFSKLQEYIPSGQEIKKRTFRYKPTVVSTAFRYGCEE